nr:MAG TPA: hypothetical protein [Caudoviricetes sp.]
MFITTFLLLILFYKISIKKVARFGLHCIFLICCHILLTCNISKCYNVIALFYSLE